MAILAQRYYSSFSWPKMDSARMKVAAYKACKGAVSFLTDNRNDYLRAGLAAAFDFWRSNSLANSLFLANAAVMIANRVAPIEKASNIEEADNLTLKRIGVGFVCDVFRGLQASTGYPLMTSAALGVLVQSGLRAAQKLVESHLVKDRRLWPEVFGAECDQLFPIYRDRLPPNWQSMVEQVPKCETLRRFEEEAESFGKVDTMKEWAAGLNGSFSGNMQDLLDLMLQKSPLFARAWDLANHPQKLTIELVEKADWGIHSAGENALYDCRRHVITLERGGSVSVYVENLVFETINALQRETFQVIDAISLFGKIDREEYTLLNEWAELNSQIWRRKILHGNPRLDHGWNFENYWSLENTLSPGGTVRHADYYREMWSEFYADLYCSRNVKALRERTVTPN